jgi:hypothetical protein
MFHSRVADRGVTDAVLFFLRKVEPGGKQICLRLVDMSNGFFSAKRSICL